MRFVEDMDDSIWVPMDSPGEEGPRIGDSIVNKQRLLIMKAASANDHHLLETILFSLPATETPLVHSAMCRAASRGHLRAFTILARYCEDIHADDSRRATNAVISSVVGGHFGVLDFILANGGHIDRPTSSGRTALSTVLSLGRWDLLTLVLSRGADVNKLSTDGRSCLCIVATSGRLDLLETLLQHGASVNCGCHCYTPGRFDRFHCALDIAALRCHNDVIMLLLHYGACLFRESDLFLTVLDSLLQRGEDHLAKKLLATGPNLDCSLSHRKITPLCLAVQRGNLAIVRFFVTCGASIHIPSQDGPPLCYAVLVR
jgi:ankyrin repeat protein